MEPFIKINGTPFPYPKRGLQLVTSTVVDSARNINGEVVGQKVCRDLYKVNQCEWPALTAEQWSNMLKILDEFFVYVTFPDQVRNQWITLKMYPGDRTAEPYWLDASGLPKTYINCKVNLIDAGSDENLPPVRPEYKLQNKSVAPGKSPVIVTADGGYYGLREVRISAVPDAPKPRLQYKLVKPGKLSQIVTPDQGYDGLSQVDVDPCPKPILETKFVTSGEEQVTVKPTPGYDGIEQVVVQPIPSEYHKLAHVETTVAMTDFTKAPEGTATYKSYLDVNMNLAPGEKIGDAFAKPRDSDVSSSDMIYFTIAKITAIPSPKAGYVRLVSAREPTSGTSFGLAVLAILG